MERHKYTREEASAAARKRWADEHAGLPARPDAVSLIGRLLRQVTVADMITGKQHVLSFYGTKRLNCFDVLVDGNYWRTCGWSQALAKVSKSCVRLGRER
jgi:hypothetical protein